MVAGSPAEPRYDRRRQRKSSRPCQRPRTATLSPVSARCLASSTRRHSGSQRARSGPRPLQPGTTIRSARAHMRQVIVDSQLTEAGIGRNRSALRRAAATRKLGRLFAALWGLRVRDRHEPALG